MVSAHRFHKHLVERISSTSWVRTNAKRLWSGQKYLIDNSFGRLAALSVAKPPKENQHSVCPTGHIIKSYLRDCKSGAFGVLPALEQGVLPNNKLF